MLFSKHGFTFSLFHSLGCCCICHLHHLEVLLHSKFSCLHHESQCKASLEQPFKQKLPKKRFNPFSSITFLLTSLDDYEIKPVSKRSLVTSTKLVWMLVRVKCLAREMYDKVTPWEDANIKKDRDTSTF